MKNLSKDMGSLSKTKLDTLKLKKIKYVNLRIHWGAGVKMAVWEDVELASPHN